MQAAVVYGPGDVRIEEVPEPEPNDANIVVKVGAASICNGSDGALFTGDRDLTRSYPNLHVPIIGGHESSGEVVAVGKAVEGIEVGDRIAYWCKPWGSWAEYVDLYPHQVSICKLSDSIGYPEGSVMELLGSTMQRAEEICLGETVVVFGLGPAGLFLLQEVRLAGAHRVIGVDMHRNRLDMALALGADAVVDAAREEPAKAIMDSFGLVDVVSRVTRPTGKYMMYGVADKGVAYDAHRLFYRCVDIYSNNPRRYDVRQLMVRGERLVRDGRLDVRDLITHHIELEDIMRGLELVSTKKDQCIKVVIDF